MSRSLLKTPLLDLTWLRPSHHGAANVGSISKRSMQQLAVQPSSSSVGVDPHTRSLYRRRRRNPKPMTALAARRAPPPLTDLGTVEELEKRVEQLGQTQVSEEAIAPPAPYSEEELLAVYEDLLAVPTAEATPASASHLVTSSTESSEQIVQGLHERLLSNTLEQSPTSLPGSFAQRLRERTDATSGQPVHESIQAYSSPRQIVLARIERAVTGLESIESITAPATVSTGLVTVREWEALVDMAIQEGDGKGLERTFDLMKRSNVSVTDELICRGMKFYADQGDVVATESFMGRFITEAPSEGQRDLHVKAHLVHAPPHTIPHSALNVLHAYEGLATPAPMKTYSRAISSLLSVRSPEPGSIVPVELASPVLARAQAWDLFAHMRYVAHPNPDAHLYTLMIRACAPAGGRSPFSPAASAEPERALDLWTEMTVDARLEPTTATYEAVIRACARAGERRYVDEAFRLARECLEGSRDAYGRSPFVATSGMCRALLDGAKRIGELGRVRWILAEMVRVAQEGAWETTLAEAKTARDQVFIDEETMMHVFHAYAAYKPPFRRSATLVVNNPPEAGTTSSGAQAVPSNVSATSAPSSVDQNGNSEIMDETSTENFTSEEPSSSNGPRPLSITSYAEFPTVVPQTRAEILTEGSFLFSRIVNANESPATTTNVDPTQAAFSNVQLTPRLINAYLSVHYAHARTRECHALWREAGTWAGGRNARSYVEALERCANSRRGHDREGAYAWAEEIWAEWESIEQAWREGHVTSTVEGVSARMVERAHAAMIRLLAITKDNATSMQHLRNFVQHYPPRAIRTPAPALPMRSTRTILEDSSRPLVRLTNAALVADDHVPPLLTFSDLGVLHQRLVAAKDSAGVGYITYVCKAYEGELRRRRDVTMRAQTLREKARAIKSE